MFGAPVEEKPKDKGDDAMDEFKKTNVGMLRIPFETKVNWKWTYFFRNLVLFLFTVAALTLCYFMKLFWIQCGARWLFTYIPTSSMERTERRRHCPVCSRA